MAVFLWCASLTTVQPYYSSLGRLNYTWSTGYQSSSKDVQFIYLPRQVELKSINSPSSRCVKLAASFDTKRWVGFGQNTFWLPLSCFSSKSSKCLLYASQRQSRPPETIQSIHSNFITKTEHCTSAHTSPKFKSEMKVRNLNIHWFTLNIDCMMHGHVFHLGIYQNKSFGRLMFQMHKVVYII